MNGGSCRNYESRGCEATATKNIQTIDHYASFLTTSDEKYRKIHDKIFDVEAARCGKEFIQQILMDNDSLRKSREKLLEICRPLAQQNAEYANQLQALKKQCENTSKMCVAWQHAKDQMYLLFKKTEKESEEKSKKLEIAEKSNAQLRRLLAIKTKKKTDSMKKTEDSMVDHESSSISSSDPLTQQKLDSNRKNEEISSAVSDGKTVTTNADKVSSDEELNLCDVISAWSIKNTESTSTSPQDSSLQSSTLNRSKKAAVFNSLASTAKMNRSKRAVKKAKKERRKTVSPEPLLPCDNKSDSSSNASSLPNQEDFDQDPMLDLVDDFNILNTVPTSECNKPTSKRLDASLELLNPTQVNLGKNKFTTPFIPPTTSPKMKSAEPVSFETKLPFKLPKSSPSKQKKKTRMKKIPTVIVPRNLRSRKLSNLHQHKSSLEIPANQLLDEESPDKKTNRNAAIKVESNYETIFDDLEISDSDSSTVQSLIPSSQVPDSPVKIRSDGLTDAPTVNATKPSSVTLDSLEYASLKAVSSSSKKSDTSQLSSDDDYSSCNGNNLCLLSPCKSPSFALSSDEILAAPSTKSTKTCDVVHLTQTLSDTSISSIDLSENVTSDAADGVASFIKSQKKFNKSFNTSPNTVKSSSKSIPATSRSKTHIESSTYAKLPVSPRKNSVKSVNISPKFVPANRIKTLSESSCETECSPMSVTLPARSCKKSAKSVNVFPKLVSINRIKTLSESSCEIDCPSEKCVVSPVGSKRSSAKSAVISSKSVAARKIKATNEPGSEVGCSFEVSNDGMKLQRIVRISSRTAIRKVIKLKKTLATKQSKKLSKSPPDQKVPTTNNKTSDCKYKSVHSETMCDLDEKSNISIMRISPNLMENELTRDKIPSTPVTNRKQFISDEYELTTSEMMQSSQTLSSVEHGRKKTETKNIIVEEVVKNSDEVKLEKSEKRKRKGKKCDPKKREVETAAEENAVPNLGCVISRKLEPESIKKMNSSKEILLKTIDQNCDGTSRNAMPLEYNLNKIYIEDTKLCFLGPFSVDSNLELQGINVSTPPEDTKSSDIDSPNMITPPLSPYSPMSPTYSIRTSPQHYSTSPPNRFVTSPRMEKLSTGESFISQENDDYAISSSSEDEMAEKTVQTEVEKSYLSVKESLLPKGLNDSKCMNEKPTFPCIDINITDQEVEECMNFDLDGEDLWKLVHEEFFDTRVLSPLPVNDPVDFVCLQVVLCEKNSNNPSEISCLLTDSGEKKLNNSVGMACPQIDLCEKENDPVDFSCPQTDSSKRKSNDPIDLVSPQTDLCESTSNDPIGIASLQADLCEKKSNDPMDVAGPQIHSSEKKSNNEMDIACPQTDSSEKKSIDSLDSFSPKTGSCENKSNDSVDIACPQADLCEKKWNDQTDIACPQTDSSEKKSSNSVVLVRPQMDSCGKKLKVLMNVALPLSDSHGRKSNDLIDIACSQSDSFGSKSNDSKDIYSQTDSFGKESNDPTDTLLCQTDACKKKSKLPVIGKLKFDSLDSRLSGNLSINLKSPEIQNKLPRKVPRRKKRNQISLSKSCNEVGKTEVSSVGENSVLKESFQNDASTGKSGCKIVEKIGSTNSSVSEGNLGINSGADNFAANVKSVPENILIVDSAKPKESLDLVSDQNANKNSSMKSAALTLTIKQQFSSSSNKTHHIALKELTSKQRKRYVPNFKVAIPRKRSKQAETSTNDISNLESIQQGHSLAPVKNITGLQCPPRQLRSTPVKSLANPVSSPSKKGIIKNVSSKCLASSQNGLTPSHTDPLLNSDEDSPMNDTKHKTSDIIASNSCIKLDNPKSSLSSNLNCINPYGSKVFVSSTQDLEMGSNSLKNATEKHTVKAVNDDSINCKASVVNGFKSLSHEAVSFSESSATALSNNVSVQNKNIELSTSVSINNDAPPEAEESNDGEINELFSLVPKSIQMRRSVRPEAPSERYECEGNCLWTCFKYYREEHCKKFIEEGEKRKQRTNCKKKPPKKYLSKEVLRKTLTDLTKPSETWSDSAAVCVKNLENSDEKLVVESIINKIEEDKSDINKALFPPSTTTQKLLLVLCHKLVVVHPTLIESLLKAIERMLFNWDSPLKEEDQPHDWDDLSKGESQTKMKTKAQMKLEKELQPKKISNLSAFFTLTCKSLGQLQRCRSFIFDALYMSIYRSHLIIHSVLSVWPNVFLRSSKSTECPLTMVTVYEIFSHKHSNTYRKSRNKKFQMSETTDLYKVEVLKGLLCQYYGYSNPQLAQITRGSIMTTLTSMLERPGCVEAFVLLAKRGLWEWAASKMVSGFLFPLLEDFKTRRINEAQAKVVVKILGLVARAFPLGAAWLEMKKVLAYLESLLMDEKLGTTSFKEEVVISIVQLYKADPDFCLSILSRWNPPDGKLSVEFLETIKSMFYCKKLMHWYQQISATGLSV